MFSLGVIEQFERSISVLLECIYLLGELQNLSAGIHAITSAIYSTVHLQLHKSTHGSLQRVANTMHSQQNQQHVQGKIATSGSTINPIMPGMAAMLLV